MHHPLIEPLESRIAPASTLGITQTVARPEGNTGTTAFSFDVTLSEAPTANVTVDFATADGTATAGSDYTAQTGTLTFSVGGPLTQTITVLVTGDILSEADETFTVALSNPTAGTTITNGTGTGTIENDPRIALTKTDDVFEGDSGTQTITFAATLTDGPATSTVVANRIIQELPDTSPNRATVADNDYVAVPAGAFTFTPGGPTSLTLPVTINGDTKQELDESFDLRITTITDGTTDLDIPVDNNSLRATIKTELLTVTQLATTVFEGASGQSLVTYEIKLGDYEGGFPVTVDYATVTGGANGNAGVGSDFASTTGTLTFANATPQTVSVAIYGDTVAEASETFTFRVEFAQPGGAIPDLTRETVTTIVNDDVSVSIADNAQTVSATQGLAELNTGTQEMTFVVTLAGAITAPVTVNYATVDGTGVRGATAGSGDFVAESGTLTFTPGGPATQQISITINGDTDANEVSESFTVVLSALAAPGLTTTITDASGLGTIKNDDSSVSLTSLGPVAEGQSGTRTMGFRATLSAALPDATTFTYSTADGATNPLTLPTGTAAATVADNDYVAATNGTITIPAGQTVADFFVTVRGDTAIESDEVFTVTLPANVPDTIIGTRSVLGRIQNDDPALSISDVTVTEGTGGTATATFVVTLSQASATGETVTVKYATGDGTATSGGATPDFTAVADQTLTFAAGETQKTVTINVTGDNRFENAETFTVTLSDPKLVRTSGETALTLARATGTATITDDDRPTVSIVPTARVAENAGAATFNVTLSNPSDVEIRVDYRTQDGTALAGSDYTGLPLSTLIFTPGLVQSSISVLATPDSTNEADETFQVLLSNARIANPPVGVAPALTIGTATSIGTIVNDDRSVTIGGASLVEDAAAMNFTVTLSAATPNPVTVFFSTRAGGANPATSGADFTATSGSLVIPANATTGTISIPIREDLLDEVDQTFEVQLTSATNAVIGGNGIGVGTILDDDAAPTAQIVPALSFAEGDGTSVVLFNVSLSQPSEKVITVEYATASGTAQTSSDFTLAAGTLTFAAGESVKAFPVDIRGDTVAEADETFTATISAPVNATLGTTVTSTATILNDDVAPSLSIADVVGRENAGSFTFNVSLSRAYAVPVTVQFTTVDVSALAGSDYTATTGSLTFAANETSKTIVVPIANNDATAEPDERFLVRLSAPTNAVLADAEATGLIQNDDVAFTVQDLTVTEEVGGNAARDALVTVTRTGTTAAAVQFRTVDGTALSTGGRDFTATTGTLSFAAGELSKTISIPIAVDAAYELNEQFTVELFSPVNAVIDDGTASVTITDNDAAPTLSVAPASAAEGANSNRVTFTVQLSAPNEREDVTLQFETIDGTAVSTLGNADFTAPTGGVGEVRFTRGTTSQAVNITTVNDARDENDETFTLRLKNANATFAGGGATLETIGTILDNDPTPTVSLTGGLTIGENESGAANRVFTARLSGPSDKTVTVNWSTAASTTGTAATPGVDFTAVTGGVLTFAPNVTEQTFSVVVADDALDEVDEVFDVVLATPTNATLGTTARATATITDNDAAPVLVIGDSSIVEGAAPAIVFTVSLSAASGREITVNYSTGASGDTATATGPFKDYDAVTGATLTFAPGETSKTISLPIIDDGFREEVAVVANDDFTLEGERFTVTLASPTNATLGDATAQGLILNGSDTTLGLAFSNSGAAEGAQGGQTAQVFNVLLSAPAVDPVSFNVTTRNGTAIAGVDFAAIANAVTIAGESTTTENDVTTRSPGATSTTVTVNAIGDNAFETAEFFFVDASGFTGGAVAVNANAEGVATGRGVIYNDDFNLLNNGRTLQWTDVDGDLVTMTTTRGSFAELPTATYTTTDSSGAPVERRWLQPTGDFGGSQLALLSLINLGGFAGAAINISAEVQVGFFDERAISDGLVHVGEIRAAQRIASGELDWVGIDLHSVTVEGDLAKIVAGDNVSTTALRRLDVVSLGRLANAPGGANDRGSEVLGPIGTVLVRGDLVGQLKLIGQEFGRIGSLTIEGALRGGPIDNTGQVLVSGSVGRATIGEIVGGAGANSGALIGNQNNGGSLGDVTVLGAVTGGSGRISGSIQALRIGDVKIGSLTGGSGVNSGLIFANGGNIASLTVEGGIAGGIGESSGQVFAAGAIGHVKATSLTGGTGASSGLIRANGGAISSVTFTGALTGGAGDNSGQIFAQTSIGHVKLAGIVGGAGDGSGAIGLTKTPNEDTNGNAIYGTSGSVRSLTVASSIVGGGGDFSGLLAAQSVGPVQIGADLTGGAGDASGQVLSVGTLGRVTIGNDVIGGAGSESGAVKAGRLTEVRIVGDVIGGAGVEAGTVEGGSLSQLTIGGAIVGSAGTDSGSVRISGDATKITVGENTAGQSLIGSSGVRSGRMVVGDDLRQVILAGDIVGGAASFTGGLIVGGDLTTATLRGSIVGGAAAATGAALQNSGFLQVGLLKSAVLSGNLTAGTDAGAGNTNSGVIRTGRMESLIIEGNVTGTATNPAVISGQAAIDPSNAGIGSLLIKGNVSFADILSGFDGNTSQSYRGNVASADAQIGKVEIRGTTAGLNIIAGAAAGAEGRFGDATDVIASGATVRDSDRVISSIASVILRGGANGNAASYGIVAQHVVSVRTGVALTPLAGLARGAGNDLGATDVADLIAANFRAVELPV
jgi:hypothetical protein